MGNKTVAANRLPLRPLQPLSMVADRQSVANRQRHRLNDATALSALAFSSLSASLFKVKAVVQRVARARVTVGPPDGLGSETAGAEVTGEIGHGLCVLVGVTHDDTEAQAVKLAQRLWKLRIFSDDEDKMNRSVNDVGGSLLIVSQFTLYADARKGNRPSYVDAARPEVAEPLIERAVAELRSLGAKVETGRFRADMDVELVNDGPVTIILEV